MLANCSNVTARLAPMQMVRQMELNRNSIQFTDRIYSNRLFPALTGSHNHAVCLSDNMENNKKVNVSHYKTIAVDNSATATSRQPCTVLKNVNYV